MNLRLLRQEVACVCVRISQGCFSAPLDVVLLIDPRNCNVTCLPTRLDIPVLRLENTWVKVIARMEFTNSAELFMSYLVAISSSSSQFYLVGALYDFISL